MTNCELKEATKRNAIQMTGHSESQMMKLAIILARQKCDDWLKQAESEKDFVAYQHYTTLKNAYGFMLDGYEGV